MTEIVSAAAPSRSLAWRTFLPVTALVVGLLIAPSLSAAQSDATLPRPLTLNAVLQAPIKQQYAVMAGQAALDQARSERDSVDSWYGPDVSVTGRLRYIQPSNAATDQDTRNDNAIGIHLRQHLFDFGRQQHLSAAAQQNLAGADLSLLSTEQKQRLAVLAAFFGVLLADQRYTVLNERMAIYYVRYDKAKDRRDLGLTSDYDLARFEREYQQILLERAKADAQRRITRRRLAEVLGRPGQVPQKLVVPKLAHLFQRKAPELEAVLQSVQKGDPGLKALQARYAASEDSLMAARQTNSPTIYAQVDGAYYERELGSRDPFRAGVYIKFPLYQGGLHNAAIGKAQAERMKLQAAIARRSATLREQATNLLEMIQVYRGAGQTRVKALENYSDLNFTRKQTLYQMEKATDLGDAMVEESAARLERMKNAFSLAMSWARLAALEGRPIAPILAHRTDPVTPNNQEPTP